MKSPSNPLSRQENIIAGLTASGLSQKEIADKLQRSIGTIAVQQRAIHEKLGINKSTELTKWWFCAMFGISENQVKEKLKEIGAGVLAILFCAHLVFIDDNNPYRRTRAREERQRTERIEPRRLED